MLESVYQKILAEELVAKGFGIRTEAAVPITFKNRVYESAFRADLIVEDSLIVELKSIERVLPVHRKQLLTYLKLTNTRLGLLINFGSSLLKDGIVRIANDFDDSLSIRGARGVRGERN